MRPARALRRSRYPIISRTYLLTDMSLNDGSESASSGSQGSLAEGNTNSSAKVRINGFYAWMGTLFVDPNDQANWRSRMEDIIRESAYGIAQLEECPETGKPHIQFYMVRKQRTRLETLKNKFDKTIHWEKRRGTEQQAIEYCMKKESQLDGPLPWGDITTEFAPKKRPLVRYKVSDLYGWQKIVYEECKLDEPCHPRSRRLIYCWSNAGKVGKSTFAMSLVDSKLNCVAVAGKVADAINVAAVWMQKNKDQELHIIVLDCPRVCGSHLSWNALEQLSNGLLVNTKYETASLRFSKWASGGREFLSVLT